MDNEMQTMKLPQSVEDAVSETPWTRGVAAGSLLIGALLLAKGRRRSGLAVAAAGATVALLENPQALREAWESLPRFLRSGQDFLLRVEDFIDEVNKQGSRLKKALNTE
jgi:hypothetical protein